MQTTEHLFEQFTKLAKSVKKDVAKKGIVIPSQQANGNIRIGKYIIAKKDELFYISELNGNVIFGPLNLAKTAVVLANDLALGKRVDITLVHNDQWFGFKAFEEQVANNIANNQTDFDIADLNRYKADKALLLKQQYKQSIDTRYHNLCKLL